MKIDVVSIFPAYLDALQLSLPGKARAKGLLEIGVHDLRAWTHDRHRTVDDTPYGGGAGMVMRAEPWGEALDDLLRSDGSSTVIVPTPSGQPFTQVMARELAAREHLLFACGRYEGIDQRVLDHAAEQAELIEVSIGDYVLNGGEVAALAIIEAVIRLLPGFMGNAASLVEESHEDGLLEYPVYTKPPVWRDREVPAVLLSGHHGAIAEWRHDQRLRRTAQRRPDLLAPASLPDGTTLRAATVGDAGELLTLQRACWMQEQLANPGVEIPALAESLDDVRRWLDEWTVLVAHREGRLVAAARGRAEHDASVWDVGRLMVAPDLQGQGLGRWMLARIEASAPSSVTAYTLFTGANSQDNIRMYRKAGYRLSGTEIPGAVGMVKPVPGRNSR